LRTFCTTRRGPCSTGLGRPAALFFLSLLVNSARYSLQKDALQPITICLPRFRQSNAEHPLGVKLPDAKLNLAAQSPGLKVDRPRRPISAHLVFHRSSNQAIQCGRTLRRQPAGKCRFCRCHCGMNLPVAYQPVQQLPASWCPRVCQN